MATFWKKLRPILWPWRGVVIAAPCTTALVVLLRLTGLLQTLEWAAYDQLFRLRPEEPRDPRIVVIGVTESDLQQYGWPLSDAVLARLLNAIKQQQPRAIGLDLYRDLPVEPGYAELVKVFETTPNLIGIEKVVGDTKSSAVAPPPVLAQLDQSSASDVVLDADGKLRRGLLSLTNGQGDPVLSFAFRLAMLYLENEEIYPDLTPQNQIRLGQAVFPPFEANDGGYIRTDAGGYQVLLNFRGPVGSFEMVSVQDVLNQDIPSDLMRDRVVLIGSVAESLRDLFYTSYNSDLIQSLPPTPGVELHAQLTSQLISAALNGRSTIRTWSDPVEWVWTLGWSFIGASLVWQLWRIRRSSSAEAQRTSSPYHLSLLRNVNISLGLAIATGGLICITYFSFLEGWWLPIVPAFLGMTGSAIVVTAYIAHSAEEIRGTFGRYLTEEVVANLLETPEGLKLGGERRNITILISDIRGFTAISEQLSPEQVVTLLNLYLETMTTIIRNYGGTINEVIGDGIVVLFGAPTQRPDDAERAVACAIAMQQAMKTVNQQNRQLHLPPLEMGIGINTGEVIVGNIGSQKRAKYTAIGSQVNLADRIESLSVGGQILISDATCSKVGPRLKISSEMQVEMKGVHAPVTLHEVSGIGEPYNLQLPDTHSSLVPLQPEIAIEFVLIDGKHLVGPVMIGSLVQLSHQRAEVRSPYPIAPFREIKLNLIPPLDTSAEPCDIYAKVLAQVPSSQTGFYIHFTSLPAPVASFLSRKLNTPCQ